MDGWIKWLGELVWRMSRLPAKVQGDEREENFYYRLYGVLCLFLTLVILAYVVYGTAEPLSRLITELVNYAGPDKILAQSYVGGLVIIVVFLIIVVVALLVSTLISIPAGVSLLVVRVIGGKSYVWANRFQATKREAMQQRERLLLRFLRLLAGFIVWVASKTGTKPPEKSTPEKAA